MRIKNLMKQMQRIILVTIIIDLFNVGKIIIKIGLCYS